MATPGVLKKEKTVAQFELDDADMKRVDNSHPTKVMREELEALGIALPDPEEQLRLSKLFNEKLEIWRFEEHKGVSVSWFNLFAEIDEDGSGYVTFDEVRNVCSPSSRGSGPEALQRCGTTRRHRARWSPGYEMTPAVLSEDERHAARVPAGVTTLLWWRLPRGVRSAWECFCSTVAVVDVACYYKDVFVPGCTMGSA